MGHFLSASHLHCFSRFDGDDAGANSTPPSNQNVLDLIARFSKENGGVVHAGSGDKIIYAFKEVESATKAGIAIQKELDFINASNHVSPIQLASIGIVSLINPFTGLKEEERSVQLAAFMAESAGAGELYLSEGAYEDLKNPEALLCRFTRQLLRTGEERALNAYEVFWNPTEVDLGKLHKDPNAVDLELQPIRSFGLKLVAGIVALFLGVLLLTIGYESLWVWFVHIVNR
jgi:hypothetical protein